MPVLTASAAKTEISHSELSQRVAVIKRFKELLKAQRDRFQAYLNALDKQKDVIESGTADDLLHHVELEEKIVSDIFSIQNVIDPLEKMYQSTSGLTGFSKVEIPAGGKSDNLTSEKASDDEVMSLKEALEGLKAEAVVRSGRNRELLSKRMAELRSEIKSLKGNAYAQRRFSGAPAPSLIDLKG
jgi:uncharacterized small protein (DUF1192 family)